MAISLIKKYGVVPSWVMPETVHSTGTAKYLPILNRKLREDALELRAMAKEGKDTAARREEMLAEIYNALCILYGQPPRSFDFEYTDKDEHYHCDRNLTPHTFLEKYVGNDLDDYVVIISSPIHALNRTYCQPFMGDVVEENMFWLNLSQEELEDLTIRQLQAGEGVMFSCDCHPDGDRANGYWDPDCFQYGEVLQGDSGLDYKAYANMFRDNSSDGGGNTASNYGKTIRAAVGSNNLDVKMVKNIDTGGASEDQLVTWVESHDNYANGDKESTGLTDYQIMMGWAVVGSRRAGAPLYFNRPKGSGGTNPQFAEQSQLGDAGDDMWKNKSVAAVNHFRNAMDGKGENLQNCGDKSCLMIERSTSCLLYTSPSPRDA